MYASVTAIIGYEFFLLESLFINTFIRVSHDTLAVNSFSVRHEEHQVGGMMSFRYCMGAIVSIFHCTAKQKPGRNTLLNPKHEMNLHDTKLFPDKRSMSVQ